MEIPRRETALRQIDEFIGYEVKAKDADVGHIDDLYFDDASWMLRYFILGTSGWFARGRLLVPPRLISGISRSAKEFTVDRTREQILTCRSADEDKPVSYQKEEELAGRTAWPPPPFVQEILFERFPPDERKEKKGDPHLRSAREVMGYHIQAVDGEIGYVDSFIVEEGEWVIRYLIVDTRKWLPGKKVLIAPQWIERISWEDRKVFAQMNVDTVRDSPEYKPSSEIKREDELRLYDYYRKPPYWMK